ncbi:MAG: carboxypeptidase regulatory-like domain-containing protein [Acidobacteria bacterium]|nr:carboxypeptidase regulatory-like domain-containing protein [Acidobacteriota bacterium]
MRRPFFCFCLLIFLFSSQAVAATSELRGTLKDPSGHPIANLAFSLVRAGVRHSMTSNQVGQFTFKNLPPGEYLLRVEGPNFKTLGSSTVSILSGNKTFVSVVLQEVFDVDDTRPLPKNYELRTILRNTADGRLIFRNNPTSPSGNMEAADWFHGNGVIEVYSGSGWGNRDFTVVPGSPYAGMLTNFAYSQDFPGRMHYVFSGQMISGEDSLWKVRNSARYEVGGNQSLEMSLGYTRLASSSSQPIYLTDLNRLGQDSRWTSSAASARTLALGLRHEWSPDETIRLEYGVEMDHFRAASSRTFLSPALRANWKAWAGGEVVARVMSKYSTRYNTLRLPNGSDVEVGDSIHLTKVGNTVRVGTSRRYEIIGLQEWGPARGEFSVFRDQLCGGAPYLLYLLSDPARKDIVVQSLPLTYSVQQGIRAGVTGGSDTLNYAVDYVYGTALGFDESVSTAKSVSEAMKIHRYHGVMGRVQGTVPRLHTVVAGMVRIVPGKPVTTVDQFNDTWNISNQSVNFFLRQVIPFPDLLGFSPRLEALLDLRNVLNQDVGTVHTETGDFVLVRNPRSVRGGISLNF